LQSIVDIWLEVWSRKPHTRASFARAGNGVIFARRCALFVCVGIVCTGAAAAQSPVIPPPFNPAGLAEEPITPIPLPPVVDAKKLALGERLYMDTRLSSRGDLACSSCHDIRSNGAGGRKTNIARDVSANPSPDKSKARFDTLTVFNAALNFRLNWEGNFRTPAAQIESSLQNPENMNTSVEEVVRKLRADPDISNQFWAAYEREPDRESFLDALVTFEQSLVTPGSAFDRWLGGDTSALSDRAQEGYRLFKALGCSSCHQGVNVGGNLMERQGVFRELVATGPAIVRVPSLRNVAVTAPYFHDGSAVTLADAIRRMGAAQLDRTLSDQHVDALVAFLQSLTGNYRGAPVAEARP
jgi:cytochrome c peroxidase